MVEDTLKERCSYDPKTGEIVWKSTKLKAIKGNKATSIATNGYGTLRVTHNKKRYSFLAHRVAWFLQTGSWPKGVIDHIDNNPLNNSICNLRDCSQSQNLARRRTKTRALPRGVSYVPNQSHKNPYVAQLKCKYVGYFETAELASEAYEAAFEKEYGLEWRK